MSRPAFKLTLNRLFILIIALGLLCLAFIGYILLKEERENTIKKWQMATVQTSSASTSSYYSGLITNLVLGNKDAVRDILDIARNGENLLSIEIVPQSKITMYILETCEVDNSQSFFHQVPTCIEYAKNSLFIYHELRSTGYNLGYLKKEVPLPHFGLFDNKVVLQSYLLVLFCFILINVFILFVLRRYFIRPIRGLTDSLSEDRRELNNVADKFGIEEIKRMAVAMNEAFDTAEKYQDEARHFEFEVKMGKLASQVAHDIRSPLAALNVATSMISELPEDNRLLIRRAVQRINDIANELIIRSKRSPDLGTAEEEEAVGLHLISCLIESIISEKRLQFRTQKNVDIDFQMRTENYGLFAKVNPAAFKIILSNLINNSVEAFEGDSGEIHVNLLTDENGQIVIEVMDNGKGIPREVLPQLMKEGASFGKKKGTGLGLFHASKTIQSWNGFIKIQSTEKTGTSVKISLPRVSEPDWFIQQLALPENAIVVVLDDDDSIHEIWKGRFNKDELQTIKVLHFKNPHEVIEWYDRRFDQSSSIFYLFDHELIGFDLTGLDVAEKLGISEKTILVTSRFDEDPVRQSCITKKVRMIPKALAGFVPIYVKNGIETPLSEAEFILIDDNKMTRDNWEYTARLVGKKLITYDSPHGLMKNIDSVLKETAIYVDANLADGLHGRDVTKDLYDKGFKNIYLATGSHPTEFTDLWWVIDVIGKEPPFLGMVGKS